jgi:hypothetical protein
MAKMDESEILAGEIPISSICLMVKSWFLLVKSPFPVPNRHFSWFLLVTIHINPGFSQIFPRSAGYITISAGEIPIFPWDFLRFFLPGFVHRLYGYRAVVLCCEPWCTAGRAWKRRMGAAARCGWNGRIYRIPWGMTVGFLGLIFIGLNGRYTVTPPPTIERKSLEHTNLLLFLVSADTFLSFFGGCYTIHVGYWVY